MGAEIRDGRGVITEIKESREFIAFSADKNRTQIRIVGRKDGEGFAVKQSKMNICSCIPGDAYQLADGLVAVGK